MLFNSLEFIYGFLPLTLGLFYLSSHFRLFKLCKLILLAASLFFYGYWNTDYLMLIVFSIFTNFAFAAVLEKYRKKILLGFAVSFNLGLLGCFKYLSFVWTNLRHVVALPPIVALALPLGISFYTFTQITYLVDVFRQKTRTFSFADYALFVAFFPHLIAGPIVHYFQLMPQLNRTRTYFFRPRLFFKGLLYFLMGLFQKVVIADFLSPIAETGFSNASVLSFVEAWTALLAFSLQIYFDFAGYSNMAIGLGLLCNIQLPVNFNSPYQAESIIDFWRRWHITLSTFLRDYVYIPLGGNRKGLFQQYLNIFLTMLIGGFWHGAAWTFILWGAYHGILLILNHGARQLHWSLPKVASRIPTFLFVAYGWVFFKSAGFGQAMTMTQALLGLHGFKDTYFLWREQFTFTMIFLLVALLAPNIEFWAKRAVPNTRWTVVYTALLIINILFLNRESAFLYFQF